MQERQHAKGREGYHCNHDERGDECLGADIDDLFADLQAVGLRQFHDFLDLSGKHQVVTAHQELVLIYGYFHVVEVMHLDEAATLDF